VIGDEEIVETSEFDKAVYPVEIGASQTFYPDANPETSSVDGFVESTEDNIPWLSSRNHNGVYAGPSSAATTNFVRHGRDADGNCNRFFRSVALFPTAALPDSAPITAAVLSVRGHGKTTSNWKVSPNVYSALPQSNTNLVGTDFLYTRFGTTPFATTIGYDNWAEDGYNDWTLNASGKAAIDREGISKFGFRDATYDVPASMPGVAGGSAISAYFAEQGTGYKPKLVIEYTPPANVGIENKSANMGAKMIAMRLI